MAFPFRMTFTGLCALVPHTSLTRATVLLVKANTAGNGLDVHFPWLRYLGQKYSLTDTEVTVQLANPQPSPLQIFMFPAPPPAAPLPIPGTNEESSAHWIADLQAASATLNPACLANPRPSFVTSRLRLNAGHLSSSRLIEDPRDQAKITIWRWGMRDAAGNSLPGFDRAMAAQFTLNAMIDGGTITISPGHVLSLQSAAGEALVEVGNTCYCPDTMGPLEDFGWFYDLANPTTIYLPIRLGFGATDTMCPPARFAPNAAA
jgi:hypothetical protein